MTASPSSWRSSHESGKFERVADSFATFHREFAPLFGRTKARTRSEQYLRGLLVQQTDRRNAENLAEAIAGATPALQRFLPEATWSDQAVTVGCKPTWAAGWAGRCRSISSTIPVSPNKGASRSGGASIQRHVGKVANCQVGVFLAWASEQGHTLVDKALYLPSKWTKSRAVSGCGYPGSDRLSQQSRVGAGLVAPGSARRALAC